MKNFDDEFENEKEREEFEDGFKKYKEMKKSIQDAAQYFSKLTDEINTNGYALVDGKYQHLPNCTILLSKLPIFGSTTLFANYLN